MLPLNGQLACAALAPMLNATTPAAAVNVSRNAVDNVIAITPLMRR